MKPKLKVKISGDLWNVYLVSETDFEREFGKESSAMTMYNHAANQRMMFFQPSSMCKSTVIHEVTHAFFSYQYLDSAKLKPSQMEEIFCDFLASRLEQIRNVSTQIYTKLK